MAKAPKKRTKKSSLTEIKRREVGLIVNNAYQRVKFLGDCCRKPRALGIQKLYTHIRGEYHTVGMDNFLRHLIREMDWTLNLVCYFIDADDSEIIHAVDAVAVFQDFEMEEVSAGLSDVIIEGINCCLMADEAFSHETLIYYAYTLYPEFHSTFDINGDALAELMINLDDMGQYKPFNNDLKVIPSDISTLPEGIKNNGIWPRIKNRQFWCGDTVVISNTNEFLTTRVKVKEDNSTDKLEDLVSVVKTPLFTDRLTANGN